jgi:hypothetical protein
VRKEALIKPDKYMKEKLDNIKYIAFVHTIIFNASVFQGSKFKVQNIARASATSFFFLYKELLLNFCAS